MDHLGGILLLQVLALQTSVDAGTAVEVPTEIRRVLSHLVRAHHGNKAA